ncbi:carbonic anhydrase [Halospeciosus flavus]|uniref:carbonic anhydrase n=1 Tax=Halospeciosus flavus TaxID=3032283 RepID=A0ABD5Z2C3_9EURY|nr:carbonic anhydrase [Halospeciosus flavus]
MSRLLAELLRRNETHVERFQSRFGEVQDSQHPEVVTVCCADSRVLQDHLWGNEEPGRLFTCSNIGNRVVQRTRGGTIVSGDVLYPLVHAGSELVVVVGHTGCGAVTATYDHLTGGSTGSDGTGDEPPGIEHCVDLLADYLDAGVAALPDGVDRESAVNRLVEYNVDRQVDSLLDSEDVPEDVDVVGVVYDFQDVYDGRRGEIHVVNVAGETDVAALRAAHPEVAGRVDRLWEY